MIKLCLIFEWSVKGLGSKNYIKKVHYSDDHMNGMVNFIQKNYPKKLSTNKWRKKFYPEVFYIREQLFHLS